MNNRRWSTWVAFACPTTCHKVCQVLSHFWLCVQMILVNKMFCPCLPHFSSLIVNIYFVCWLCRAWPSAWPSCHWSDCSADCMVLPGCCCYAVITETEDWRRPEVVRFKSSTCIFTVGLGVSTSFVESVSATYASGVSASSSWILVIWPPWCSARCLGPSCWNPHALHDGPSFLHVAYVARR